MVNILGTIYNSAGIAVSGRLVVNLVNSMVDDLSIPPSLFIPQSYEFTITNGVVNINLEESETKETSYEFIFYVPSVEDPLVEEVLNPFPFKAVIPSQATVNLTELIPTGIVSDTLATGALRIARIIAGNPDLASNIGGVFPRGEWQANTSYKRGDIVTFNQSTYVANDQVPLTIEPTDTQYWQIIPVDYTGDILFEYKNASFSALYGYHYVVDTSTQAVIATLPEAPPNGSIISFNDYKKTFSTYSLTITCSGSDNIINDLNNQLLLDSDLSSIKILYFNGIWSLVDSELYTASVENPIKEIDTILTTRGDLVYRDSLNETSRLPVGLVDQVLTSDGTDISWASMVKGLVDEPVSFADSPITGTAGVSYSVNTTGGSVTINLPAGSAGMRIGFKDALTNFGTNNLTVVPDGTETITGLSSLVFNNNRGNAVLSWSVDGNEWIFESVGFLTI